MGRPTKFTQDLADKICETIATSNKGLRTIAAENDITVTTIMKWLSENKKFSEQYARAKEDQADYLIEEMLVIADNTTNDTIHVENEAGGYDMPNHEWINRSKLRVDVRKFIAAKLKPKKYGDKIDVTTDGKEIKQPVIINTTPEIAKNIAGL